MGEHKPKNAAGQSDFSSLPKSGVAGGVTKKKLLRVPSRKYALIILIVTLVCGGGAGFALYTRQASPKVVSVCDSGIAKEGHEQNTLKNVDTFGRLANRIKLKADYDKDPNCLYILAEYQITITDMTTAQATLEKLKADYPNFMFDKELDGGQASIGNLQKQFDRTQDAEQNSRGRFDTDI